MCIRVMCGAMTTFPHKHRNEQRGIGGLLFDDLNMPDFDHCFAFMQAVRNGYTRRIYIDCRTTQSDGLGRAGCNFQLYRRGRYVEFNLVWDRGTLFGLQNGGRTESILMSMPPLVRGVRLAARSGCSFEAAERVYSGTRLDLAYL